VVHAIIICSVSLHIKGRVRFRNNRNYGRCKRNPSPDCGTYILYKTNHLLMYSNHGKL